MDGQGALAAQEVKGPWQRYGWLMSVIWLVFLYYPIRSIEQSPASPAAVTLAWAGIGIFALAYFVGFVLGMRVGWRKPTPLVIRLFAVIALSAALTVPAIGWDAASFLPFLMAYAAYCISTRWHWISVAVAVVVLLGQSLDAVANRQQPSWMLIAVSAMMIAVNSLNTWLIDRSVATDELRMELATSEERESVARDVHDLLGHSLTAVKLKAELAMRLLERDPSGARAELEQIVQLTGEAIAGVRGTVTGLRASGLGTQLSESREMFRSAGISVETTGEPSSLSPAQALTAAWVLREAGTNVIRHAEARHVRISIDSGTFVVWDDGVGVRGKPGNGLRSMGERAAAAGATLRVESGTAGSAGLPGTKVSLVW